MFRYNGHRWSQPSSLWSARIYERGQVSCPTSGFCMLDNGHRVYLYRNGHWSAGPRLGANAVSCSSSTFCVVTGASHSGGSSFASVYRMKWGPHVGTWPAVRPWTACPAHKRLLRGRGDQGGLGACGRWRDRGHVPRPLVEQPRTIASAATGPTSISCPSDRFCAAVDAAGNAVIYDGTSWGRPPRFTPTTRRGGPCGCPAPRAAPVWPSTPPATRPGVELADRTILTSLRPKLVSAWWPLLGRRRTCVARSGRSGNGP